MTELDTKSLSSTPIAEILEAWPRLSPEERNQAFRGLLRNRREELFLDMSSRQQSELLLSMPEHERRTYLRVLPPDDVADLVQELDEEDRENLLNLLDSAARSEVRALLAYEEDDAGGLMSPRFARLRPEMRVDEAILYLRLQGRRMETIYYAYVLDFEQRLLGVVSFRDLFTAASATSVESIMRRDVVTVTEETDQEEVARLFASYGLAAIPVVDADRRMKGIVTIDDIVDVVQEEATEDIHKIGGMEALEGPYMRTSMWEMVQKRAGWLSALFIGQMLTASAMGRYEDAIMQAVVLAVFVPLIISSGGNSGAQATTLVIRAMALGEVRLRDWWRVAQRECAAGFLLGLVLAVLGFLRIVTWHWFGGAYGELYLALAWTVSLSLIGVVLWGTLMGSMLPFLLRRLDLDPASASAPFVATLVDVTGILIYFTVAQFFLRGFN